MFCCFYILEFGGGGLCRILQNLMYKNGCLFVCVWVVCYLQAPKLLYLIGWNLPWGWTMGRFVGGCEHTRPYMDVTSTLKLLDQMGWKLALGQGWTVGHLWVGVAKPCSFDGHGRKYAQKCHFQAKSQNKKWWVTLIPNVVGMDWYGLGEIGPTAQGDMPTGMVIICLFLLPVGTQTAWSNGLTRRWGWTLGQT